MDVHAAATAAMAHGMRWRPCESACARSMLAGEALTARSERGPARARPSQGFPKRLSAASQASQGARTSCDANAACDCIACALRDAIGQLCKPGC